MFVNHLQLKNYRFTIIMDILKSLWNFTKKNFGKTLFSTINPKKGIEDISSGGGLLSSAAGKYLGTNLTGAEREANAFATSEREAAQAWSEEMYNKYQSPEAQIKSQVSGMQANGINPALMYQGSPVSGGSIPSGSPGSSVSPNTANTLSSLLDMFLTRKRLQLEEKRIDNDFKLGSERNRIAAELNPSRIESNLANAWRNLTAGNLNEIDSKTRSAMNQSRLALYLAQADSQSAEAAFRRAGISVEEAKAGLIAQQALNLTIANKYADEYWQAEINLKSAQAEGDIAAANKAYAEIVRIQEEAKNSAAFGEILNQQFELNEFNLSMSKFKAEHQNVDWLLDTGVKAINCLSGAVQAGSSLSRAASYGRSVSAGINPNVIPYGAYGF